MVSLSLVCCFLFSGCSVGQFGPWCWFWVAVAVAVAPSYTLVQQYVAFVRENKTKRLFGGRQAGKAGGRHTHTQDSVKKSTGLIPVCVVIHM